MKTEIDAFPIVGVGASAGGLEALEGLFRGVPADPGLAFVIVTHLNPDRESLLHEILPRYTNLRVEIARNGAAVRRNYVYVLTVAAILGIKDGKLKITEVDINRRERKPVDVFLSELALDQGEHAVSIVLSGGDGDGTLGTKAVKERGGLTMAQVAGSYGPQHPQMPDSAISAGFVDFAITVEEMGAKLIEFAREQRALDEIAISQRKAEEENRWAKPREELYSLIRNHVGHDFSDYKSKTFIRRVQRRMLVLKLDTVEAYIEALKQNPSEINALFRDLLINVTNFFRDADAFEKLKELVIPKLFEGRGANDTVRIWTPGCATGEECYSIAMLVAEHIDTLPTPPSSTSFRNRYRRPCPCCGSNGTLSPCFARQCFRRAKKTLFRAGWRCICRQQNYPRPVYLLASQHFARPAVFAHRPRFMPQFANLLRSRSSPAGCSHVPLLVAARRLSVPWNIRERKSV